MNVTIKQRVLRRDRYRCRFCGKRGNGGGNPLTVDHIFPLARGGHPEKTANLVTACRRCNQYKANRTPEECGLSIDSEGYSYTPPGKLDEGVKELSELVFMGGGSSRKAKKKKRQQRKAKIKRLQEQGLI